VLKRVAVTIGMALVIGGAGLWLFYASADTEHRVLDDEARGGAPGRFVELSDGLTHVDVAGPENGPPVLLVHGFSVPFYIWDPTFEALAQAGFRVIRYDLYGRGFSDRPDVDYDGALFERQLGELADVLGISSPVNLVGLSMGGAVVMRYAARNPENVRRIVLVDPVHAASPPPPYPRPIGDYVLATKVIPSLPGNQLTDFVRPGNYPDWPDRYRVQMQYDGFRRAIISTLYHFMPEDHLGSYRRVQAHDIPVMLVWGEEDRTLDIGGADVVRDVLDVEFLPVPDAGHLPHIEQAAFVNPAIASFLSTRQQDSASPGPQDR
jgi:pimeloyl-ACP methyl ester carboxylesterase